MRKLVKSQMVKFKFFFINDGDIYSKVILLTVRLEYGDEQEDSQLICPIFLYIPINVFILFLPVTNPEKSQPNEEAGHIAYGKIQILSLNRIK